MTPERWQYIERLYHAALERDTDEQVAFLAEACAGDDALRGEVESLLRCDTRAVQFIESPALEVAAQLCDEDRVRSMNARRRHVDCFLEMTRRGTTYVCRFVKTDYCDLLTVTTLSSGLRSI